MAVIMKNAAFLDVTPCGSCKNRRFEERYRLLRLLVTANVVGSTPILFTLAMDIRSSETSVLTRVTRRNIPEYGILQR
jgi:hypothetical protein